MCTVLLVLGIEVALVVGVFANINLHDNVVNFTLFRRPFLKNKVNISFNFCSVRSNNLAPDDQMLQPSDDVGWSDGRLAGTTSLLKLN
jgi:hypothetical protein